MTIRDSVSGVIAIALCVSVLFGIGWVSGQNTKPNGPPFKDCFWTCNLLKDDYDLCSSRRAMWTNISANKKTETMCIRLGGKWLSLLVDDEQPDGGTP